MENTFELAKNYVEQLDKIDNNWNLDKDTIASSFMSYAEKVNKPNKETLEKFAEQFRKWQKQWDLFDKQEIKVKPKHLDEFISDLLSDGSLA